MEIVKPATVEGTHIHAVLVCSFMDRLSSGSTPRTWTTRFKSASAAAIASLSILVRASLMPRHTNSVFAEFSLSRFEDTHACTFVVIHLLFRHKPLFPTDSTSSTVGQRHHTDEPELHSRGDLRLAQYRTEWCGPMTEPCRTSTVRDAQTELFMLMAIFVILRKEQNHSNE